MAYKTNYYNALHAFDPAASVFVSANAGSGKTSLLTNRVLALLLHGVEPSRLLCLTFTKAAAAEMAGRVLERLGHWVMADEESLSAELATLIGHAPAAHVLTRSRGLFAHVLEAPEGLRIQTIHGFCQSLLRRFPIEAGLSPHFTVMDARTEQELLQEARLRLFSQARHEDEALRASLTAIAQGLSESSFHGLLAEIIQNKRRIRSLLARPGGVSVAIAALHRLLNIPKGGTKETLLEQYFSYAPEMLRRLRHICALLQQGGVTDRKTANIMTAWLEAREGITEYVRVMVKQDGDKRDRKGIFTKATLTHEENVALMLEEQERVWRFDQACRALETAERTTHMLRVTEALMSLYDQLKNRRALMDYDDLILTAARLLQSPGIAPWVLYKLDGGIDHILVDEAQDTSPLQWDIIGALTEEFFAGVGGKEQARSLFVVGDEKQSIYSFQGADPLALARSEHAYAARIRDADKQVHKIGLTHSFRSTPEILTVVDNIFAQGQARHGLMFSDEALSHTAIRKEEAGIVELWPLTETREDEERTVSAATLLARNIAAAIRRWLDDRMPLPSKNRCAKAGDIMILVRRRGPLVDRIVKALKQADIPVAGHDRMALTDNLAVKDLIALGQCLLLPEDDLTLAALLKSPFFGMTEETLFDLAWRRGDKRLWERLRERGGEAYALLADLRGRADYVPPYELYAYALDRLGGRRRMIGRMGEEYRDAIDEFLGQALLYERSHTPSLQGFLHWLGASDSEIKRDMEQTGDAVRIMTVHGSKGLQAPIVILPDTADIPVIKDTLVWYEGEEGVMPLWPVPKSADAVSGHWRERQKEAMRAEQKRLLYVALTRAEDRLYICGAAPKREVNEQSWYRLIETGLRPVAERMEMERGEGLRIGAVPEVPPPPVGRGAGATPPEAAWRREVEDFAFLFTPPPDEPTPPKPLTPSRLDDEPPAISPLSTGDSSVFQRGNMIHRLLQILPNIPSSERKDAAQATAAALPEAMRDDCVAQALKVISHPDHAFLFSENSLAEVPVAASIPYAGKLVSVAGQIDRLYIGENQVWIIDFKSNRLPPLHPKNIPIGYLQQMALYRLLLKRIYPDKTIVCALLWTVDASVTVLDDVSLDEAA